jgi:acetyl esterase/lipase
MHRILLALCLSCGVGASHAQTMPTHPDLSYAVVGGRDLMLDLYLPASGATPYPLLVWIHGGGWSGGSRFPAPGHALRMRDHGFAVASISYRLSGQAALWGGEPVTFPAQIHDVRAAIRWLRANAVAYQLDSQRIAVWGSSAGGHLAALAGTSGNDPELEGNVGVHLDQSSAVQAAVDYYGPTDLFMMTADVTTPPGSMIDHDAPNSPESRLIGYSQPGQGIGVLRANIDNPAPPFPALVLKVVQANPQTWVDADDPPFMIVHGTADTSVPFGQSVRLLDTLSAFGHTPVFVPVEGAGHGGFPSTVADQVHAFLLATLQPEVFADGFER